MNEWEAIPAALKCAPRDSPLQRKPVNLELSKTDRGGIDENCRQTEKSNKKVLAQSMAVEMEDERKDIRLEEEKDG